MIKKWESIDKWKQRIGWGGMGWYHLGKQILSKISIVYKYIYSQS